MQTLKFLGKPAPLSGQIETKANGHVIRYLREEHLEGAIKEAEKVLLAPHISGKLADIWKEWNGSLNTFRGTRHKFVAFLLRKTIGDKE